MPQHTHPTCPTLNLCLDAHQNADGTFDLRGVFNTLTIRLFPLRLRLAIHYVLVGGDDPGTHSIEIRVAVDGEAGELRSFSHTINTDGPGHVQDFIVEQEMDLKSPRTYWVRLYADGERIAERGFAVLADVGGGQAD
jgi:hypothetical protein